MSLADYKGTCWAWRELMRLPPVKESPMLDQGVLMGDRYVLTLTSEDARRLQSCAAGVTQGGGWQDLVVLLAGRLTRGGHLEMSDAEVLKVQRYIEDYGGGGYQDALRGVRRAAWAAGWKQ